MEPKVSILIPVYKAEKYISQCLESVLRQTYNNLEIIIVDDASPDNSIAIAESLIQKNENKFDIKILHNEKNKGIAETRNTLLDYATGDYILFVDSDDYIEIDAIDSLANIVNKADCDIVRCGYF